MFGSAGDRLFGSEDVAEDPSQDVLERMARGVGETTWQHDGRTFFADAFPLPLAFDFLEPRWTIVVSESSDLVFAPISRARTTFVLIALLALWIVALLSVSQIRRSLVPLARLREATARIGAGDFDWRVDVRSDDEFEELATSLNTMSRELKRHFRTQSTVGELERAVLSSLDEDTIVRRTLDSLPGLLHCDAVGLVRLRTGTEGRAAALVTRSGQPAAVELPCPAVRPAHVQALLDAGGSMVFGRHEGAVPSYASVLVESPWTTCVAVPIVLSTGAGGILLLAYESPVPHSDEDVRQIRQIAGHLGVALSNARLVRALDRLNVGTLNALARTVDAKSPWTAGHSQRVTAMAVEIGRQMAVSPQELDDLARGGLLHDIGKIAVPSTILNKPAALTADEFETMKEHPRTGARILEPIAEYHRLIPIVLQHHEWFNGGGYPSGLVGEAISLGARILAVADVYDALTSKRPYRDALAPELAVSMIAERAGTQFDPAVVAAFQAMRADARGVTRNAAA